MQCSSSLSIRESLQLRQLDDRILWSPLVSCLSCAVLCDYQSLIAPPIVLRVRMTANCSTIRTLIIHLTISLSTLFGALPSFTCCSTQTVRVLFQFCSNFRPLNPLRDWLAEVLHREGSEELWKTNENIAFHDLPVRRSASTKVCEYERRSDDYLNTLSRRIKKLKPIL